ncbi:hypothetical protein J7M02_03985 [Candidatus Aerophobetes bacterium]|nr:hypothetical protein [Candidatus Aerophobetes bacterium]
MKAYLVEIGEGDTIKKQLIFLDKQLANEVVDSILSCWPRFSVSACQNCTCYTYKSKWLKLKELPLVRKKEDRPDYPKQSSITIPVPAISSVVVTIGNKQIALQSHTCNKNFLEEIVARIKEELTKDYLGMATDMAKKIFFEDGGKC